MKKSIALILAVAMLMIACVACGGAADKNLPADDTRLQEGSMFTVKGGEVVKTLMQGKNADGSYYVYTKEDGKSSTVTGESHPLTSMLAGQFQACIQAVVKAAKAGDISLADSCDFTLTAQLDDGYEKITDEDNESVYYVYAIEKKTLVKGEGVYEGATTLGLIEFKLADGTDCLIAIDR